MRCFTCGQPATHIEAACWIRTTITRNGQRFDQVDEKRRYYCADHHAPNALPLTDSYQPPTPPATSNNT